ncbi:hypothetical protein BDU57DRAFT_560286 [Ampelomyces quisqualis]|uniref:Mid2 domain-containing protein n=1 Tax=Ampelomyces quisqualis TaxID=50730 RepID=A0A6A5Q7Q5_AMPQU|nr:hypothetical protein BDU57DRAFT_560286 [Ampelomyces quisqualis]
MADDSYTPAAPGDFFCPAGGTWYACQTGTNYVGCCTEDPCQNGCFGDKLRPTGVSTKIYNKYPGGTCAGNTDFWTCLSEPTFWGCCNANPCENNSTCPVGKLEPTFMTRPDQFEYFGALNILLSSSVPASASPTTSTNPTSLSSKPSSSVSGGVIAGAVVGGVALISIIGVVVFLLCIKKRRKEKVTGEPVNGDSGMKSESGTGYSAPPTYSFMHQGFSQGMSLITRSHSQVMTDQQTGPQELPAEHTNLTVTNKTSELPSQTEYRFSELPGSTPKPSELESPEISPRPAQNDFVNDQAKQPAQGLGLTTS